jgi:hypothetical protein
MDEIISLIHPTIRRVFCILKYIKEGFILCQIRYSEIGKLPDLKSIIAFGACALLTT